MSAINKIICVFTFGIGFAPASASGSTIKKIGNVDSIKINNGGRDLQDTTLVIDACADEVCGAECFAFDSCENYSGACYDKSFELSIPDRNWCINSAGVDTFCDVQQQLTILCTQDCQDEVQALTGCMLMQGGCSENHCENWVYVPPTSSPPVTETPTEIPTEIPTETPTETPTENPTNSPPVTDPPTEMVVIEAPPTDPPVTGDMVVPETPTNSPPVMEIPIDVVCYAEGEALGLCLVSVDGADTEECASCSLNAAISSIDGCSSSDVDSFYASVQGCGADACLSTCLDELQAAADCIIEEACPDTSAGTNVPPPRSPPVVGTPTDIDVATAPASRPTNAAVMGGGFANGFGGFAFISIASIIFAVGIM